MRIAIPVKTDKEDPPVAPLFGKAKWFAFVEDGQVSIERSPFSDGRAVMQWFFDLGVDTIIFQEMGKTPHAMIKAHGGIKLFHAGHERVLLSDVLKSVDEGVLPLMDDAKMATIIKRHEAGHSHDGHHQH